MEVAPIEEEAEATPVLTDANVLTVENGTTTTSRPNSVRPSKKSGSRRSSVAHPELVPEIHRSLSINSLRLVSPDLDALLPPSIPTFSPHPQPIAIGVASSIFSSEQQSALYASLADAATPPNSTFLSTLAGTIPSDQISTRLSHAGPSVSKRGTPLTRVVSSESEGAGDEEETDGNSNKEEEEISKPIVAIENGHILNGKVDKGKGKWVAGQEIPVEDLLEDVVPSTSSN